MGNCKHCNKEIEDKYVMCIDCLKKIKDMNVQNGGVKQVVQADNKEILNAISNLNNNLYAIRTIGNALLEETAGKTCFWDVETKTFKIGESPHILRSSNYVLWMLMEELMKEHGKIIGWNNLEKKFEIQKLGGKKK